MSLKGTAEMIARLRIVEQTGREAARAEVDDIAQDILTESKELCPVSPTNEFYTSPRTGKQIKNPLYTHHSTALQNSGVKEDATIADNEIRAKVKYTDINAAVVHETLVNRTGFGSTVRHGAALKAAFPFANIPNERGQAKFLAVPFLKFRAGMLHRVAARVKGAIGG